MAFQHSDPQLQALRARAIDARQTYTYGASDEGWLSTEASRRAAYRRAVVLTKLYERALHRQLDAELAAIGQTNPVGRDVSLSGWGPPRVAQFPKCRIIP